MFNRKFVFGALVPITAIVVSCGGDGSKAPPVSTEDIKTNYVTMAHAAYLDSLATATLLKGAVDTFIATPSEDNLDAAKVAYKAARVPYQQSEIMRFDTVITINQDLDADGGLASVDDWEGQVNAWPLDENHIVSIIEGSDTIDQALLVAQNGANNNEANVATGVHAVEFMLWGEDANGTAAGAGERPATDFANGGSCTDALCARRANYLEAATNLLVSDLTEMAAEWSPAASTTVGTLSNNFLASDLALDYMLGSITSMATDELASARMGSGLELGDPEEEHDCFSDLSHIAIYYNFQGVRNAFYGTYTSDNASVSGVSLADLIESRDNALFTEVNAAFDAIEVNMLAIFNAGERTTDTVRFDQIIGQDANGTERQIAEAAIDALIALDGPLSEAQELLSLQEINVGGSGD